MGLQVALSRKRLDGLPVKDRTEYRDNRKNPLYSSEKRAASSDGSSGLEPAGRRRRRR